MPLTRLFGATLLSMIYSLSTADAYTVELNTRNFYFGGGVGGTEVGLDGNIHATTISGVKYIYDWNKSRSNHFNIELRGGYQIKYDKLYVAGEIFGQHLHSKTVLSGSIKTPDSIIPYDDTGILSMNYLYGFRGKVGVNLSNKVSLYGIVGFAHTPLTLSVLLNFTQVPKEFDSKGQGDGLLYGVGLSCDVAKRVSLTAEYSIARFHIRHLKFTGSDVDELVLQLVRPLQYANIQTVMLGVNFLF